MSFTNPLIPTPPPLVSAIAVGDVAPRQASFADVLGLTGDTIPSVSEVTIAITRLDGVTMGPTDLAVVLDAHHNTAIDSTGQIVQMWLGSPPTTGVPGVGYLVSVTIAQTTQFQTMTRAGIIYVEASLG